MLHNAPFEEQAIDMIVIEYFKDLLVIWYQNVILNRGHEIEVLAAQALYTTHEKIWAALAPRLTWGSFLDLGQDTGCRLDVALQPSALAFLQPF